MTNSVRGPLMLALALASVSVMATESARADQRPSGGASLAGGIAVDFRAVDASGQLVEGLQPSDVSVKIAGKTRAVTALEFVKMESSGGAAPAAELPPPFATNAPHNGRNLLIVVDNESLKVGTEREMKEALEVILKGLGPSDRVAFSFAPRDTAQIGFGGGLPAVRATLAKYQGGRPASVSTEDNACRTRDSLVLLRSLIEPLVGAETPTAVLYLAGDLVLPNRGTGATQPRCEVTIDHFQAIGQVAASARVNLYVAQGDEAVTGRDGGLENLAGVTNAGTVLRAVDNGLARVLSETGGYYLATVAADPSDRPGQVQKLELRVSKEGVTARARSDVALIAKGGRGGGKSNPKEMVATTAPFGDLQLRSTAVVTRGPAGKMNVLTLTEPVDPTVKIAAATAVIIAPGATKAAFARSADDQALAGKPLLLGLAVDPGKYRVRVAAADANGRGGAVDFEVDANLVPSGPLHMAQMLPLGPRGESFSPQLVFTDEPEMAVMFELYGPVATTKIGAKVDIASTMDGKPLAEGQVGGAGTNEPDRFQINAKIPIAKLPPGDYVIRAIVQAEGQPEGKVTRTIRKVAK